MADTYEISTLEDMARIYGSLPTDRAELMLKEMGDAVRMMAPVVSLTDAVGAGFSFLPVRWINDTKGKATVRVSTDDGSLDATVKVDLPKDGAA